MFYILIGYITSIVVSKSIDKLTFYDFCKKIYDNGYRFSKEKKSDDLESEAGIDTDEMLTLIPGVNILSSIMNSISLQSNLEDAIDVLVVDGSIERMEKIEKEIYDVSPNIFTIRNLDKLVRKRLKEAYVINVKDNGKIYYELGDEYSYSIIYREGSALDLTYEETEKYLREDDLISSMDELKEFYNSLLDVSSKEDKKTPKKQKGENKYKKLLSDPYYVQAQDSNKGVKEIGNARKRFIPTTKKTPRNK